MASDLGPVPQLTVEVQLIHCPFPIIELNRNEKQVESWLRVNCEVWNWALSLDKMAYCRKFIRLRLINADSTMSW